MKQEENKLDEATSSATRIHDVVGQSEQLCPQCSSDNLFDIDDHYTECQDC